MPTVAPGRREHRCDLLRPPRTSHASASSTSASRWRRWSRAAQPRPTTPRQDRYTLAFLFAGRDLAARTAGRGDGRDARADRGCDRRRRRRVRHEDIGLSGIHRAAGRGAADRAAGALDVGPHGSLSRRQPGARHGHRRRACARCEGQVSGAAGPASGGHGRVYRRGRRQHPDNEFRPLLSLRLRHREDVDRRALRVHQRTADRTLSRRGAARGELRDGAAGGGGRACQRHRRDRAAPPQPDRGSSAMPYKTAVGTVFDSGNFAPILQDALAASGYKDFARRRKAALREGKLRGIGVSFFLEHAGALPREGAALSFPGDGTILLGIGVGSSGQGHATTFPRLVAERLGIPAAKVRLGDEPQPLGYRRARVVVGRFAHDHDRRQRHGRRGRADAGEGAADRGRPAGGDRGGHRLSRRRLRHRRHRPPAVAVRVAVAPRSSRRQRRSTRTSIRRTSSIRR